MSTWRWMKKGSVQTSWLMEHFQLLMRRPGSGSRWVTLCFVTPRYPNFLTINDRRWYSYGTIARCVHAVSLFVLILRWGTSTLTMSLWRPSWSIGMPSTLRRKSSTVPIPSSGLTYLLRYLEKYMSGIRSLSANKLLHWTIFVKYSFESKVNCTSSPQDGADGAFYKLRGGESGGRTH